MSRDTNGNSFKYFLNLYMETYLRRSLIECQQNIGDSCLCDFDFILRRIQKINPNSPEKLILRKRIRCCTSSNALKGSDSHNTQAFIQVER